MEKNREIRFRQPQFNRDGKFEEFHYWGTGIEQGGEIANIGWTTYKMGITDPKDSQQFTGLQDRNGTDIYEGDVVALPYIDPSNKLHPDKENRRGKIIFSHGCFCIDVYPEPHPLRDWCNSHQSEYIPNFGNYPILEETNVVWVLGNIYEHPELLKP